MGSGNRHVLLLIAVLAILCICAQSRFYEVREDETGWTTGHRESENISLDISGSAIGEGRYQRYTDMGLLETRMRERIAAANGTLDTEERIRLVADASNDVEVTLVKNRGNQDFIITVDERWPVAIFAQRNIDYLGKGISDREIFGNNLDYVGASYIQAEDLKKSRSCLLELQNARFEGVLNNTTKIIAQDLFQPNKTIDYNLQSHSQGRVTLKYRQAKDRIMAKEGVDDYAGSYEIARRIQMVNYYWNATLEEEGLDCCMTTPPQEKMYAARSDHH